MRSITQSLERRGGTAPGAARMRVLLVLLIVVCQSFELTNDYRLLIQSPLWPGEILATAGLFSLVGFIHAQASLRRGPRDFLLRRLRSVYPVLAIAVLAALLLLGPLVASSGWQPYVTDPETWLYALNLIGFPVFSLPGVFEFNPAPAIVNLTVWTVPVYAMTVAVATLSGRYRRASLAAPATVCGAAAVAIALVEAGVIPEPGQGSFGAAVLGARGISAILGAMLGILAARLGPRIPHDRRFAWAAGGLIAVLALLVNPALVDRGPFGALAALPAAYLTIYLALVPHEDRVFETVASRYLTGVFLYAFPIQQLVVERGGAGQGAMANLALSLPAAALLAAASWHLVQRRTAPLARFYALASVTTRSTYRRPRSPLRARLQQAAIVGAIGIAFLLLCLVVLWLTFFALQRES